MAVTVLKRGSLSCREVFLKWPFLEDLVAIARESAGAKSIILFGSRARGDFETTSDFDVAIDTLLNMPSGQSL